MVFEQKLYSLLVESALLTKDSLFSDHLRAELATP